MLNPCRFNPLIENGYSIARIKEARVVIEGPVILFR